MTELIIGCGFVAFGWLCWIAGSVRTRDRCEKELDELIGLAQKLQQPIDHTSLRRRIEEITRVDPSQ